jgi:hypothetical protein
MQSSALILKTASFLPVFVLLMAFRHVRLRLLLFPILLLEHDRKFCFLSFRISRRNKITKYEKRNLEKASTCFG